MITREQAMEQYTMDEDFIQAVINGGGTVDTAVEIWNRDKDTIITRRDAMMADGCEGIYLAYKQIIQEIQDKKDEQDVAGMELVRSNRVSVQKVGDVDVARFWKTHKVVKEVTTTDATGKGYTPDTTLNATAQRELFRQWVCKNAGSFGIQYDPQDRREDANKFPSKYTSDELLMEWACKIVTGDIQEWTGKVAEEYKAVLAIKEITADTPMEIVTRNGKSVTPKYGNGNWSYATVDVTATIQVIDGDTTNEGYVTIMVELVSGQMKKPSRIGDSTYTYTAYKTELLKDIQGFLPSKDSKAETKVEESNEPPKDETPVETPKKRRTRKSKKDQITDEQAIDKVDEILGEQ